MSSAGQSSAPLRPSVFISYASEDRIPARALRDALGAAGLDVWYDENELGGGDAWDQKIRRQIRDCDYFLPLISASTERRKEGYFRREWRLAAERTLDMADDVLFLLPVVIDDTSEINARVPEKFLSVQWLRAPGGQFTPAFEALVKRLLAGDHTILQRPPLVTRPTVAPPPLTPPPAIPSTIPHASKPEAKTQSESEKENNAPPPMPPFPQHPPKSGHWLKYYAEVIWWVITAAWLLFNRMPRWVRITLVVWFVLTLIGPCSVRRNTERPKKPEPPPVASAHEAKIEESLTTAAQEAAKAIKHASKNGKERPDLERIGAELIQRFAGKVVVTDKPILFVPFASDAQDADTTKFAQAAFGACYGQVVATRPDDAGLASQPTGGSSDEALLALGKAQRAGFVLGAQATKNTDGAGTGGSTLRVRLLKMSDGTVAWSGDFPIIPGEAPAVGGKIAEAVLAGVPAGK